MKTAPKKNTAPQTTAPGESTAMNDHHTRPCGSQSLCGGCPRLTKDAENQLKIAIIGRPNSGKSHIFSNLTQKYSPSGNYPFTTLEVKRAKCCIDTQEYEIIDTPGMQGLFINSEEELVVRDLLFTEKPDLIIQCADANRLKQALVLTADLMELELPMVLCLNAVDETARHGTWIDSGMLAQILDIPVVEMVAVSGIGTSELKHAIANARKGKLGLNYGRLLEDGIAAISNAFPQETAFKRKLAVLLLRNDSFLKEYLKKTFGNDLALQLSEYVEAVQEHYRGNISWQVINKRTHWVNTITRKIVHSQKLTLGGFSQVAARWSRSPAIGLPILLGILGTMFFSIVIVANKIAEWANTIFWMPLENLTNVLVPAGFWNEFLVGHYGILTLGVSNALLTVLPILSVFFFLFNILEDSGYIPNLCVLLKKASAKIGVTGNAVLPITLAFGCKTMATLTTKSLRSKREKFIAIYLIAFGIPCAAQMALNMSILGGLGFKALAITFSVVAAVWLLAGTLLNILLKKDRRDDFIMELPPMRLPRLKPVLKKTYYKLLHFLEEALPIFISAAVILFTAEKTGVLTAIRHALQPVITGFLELPLVMVDVLILLVANREAAAGMLISLARNGELDYTQSIVAVTLSMMFVPCLANIMAIIKEQGIKKALAMILSISTTAFLIAGLLNFILVKVI